MSGIEHTMDFERRDSRRLLAAFLLAALLHMILFAALAILRLAENPVNPAPVTVDLAPGALGGLPALAVGPSSQAARVQAQPGQSQAARSRAGSEQGFVIPTPRQGANAQSYQPSGPAFRESGTSSAQTSSAPQATSPVQEPVFPHTKTSQAGTETAAGGSSASSGAPARGVGVLVEGGSQAPVQGSLNLGSLNESIANARGAGAQPGTAAGSGGGGGGGSLSSGGGGQGNYRFQWDQPQAAEARKLLADPRPKIPLWVSKEGLSLTVLITFTLTRDGVLNDVNVEASSGYNEVDAAVSEAVRHWRFSADPSARPIHGLIPYVIRAR
jgi:TonB family protein